MPLLEVSNLRVSYGKALAIESVSIEVNKAELVGVLGPNGAGKTTLLKAISCSIASQGKLTFKDQPLAGLAPHEVVARGICHCPEGRRLFSELSVLKNLQLGAYLRKEGRNRRRSGARVCAVPGFARAAEAAIGHVVRRRAADGRHRPRIDGPPRTAAPRRALRRHSAEAQANDLRLHSADHERRHGRSARRAGRDLGAADCRSRLCPGAWPHGS
jgi:ABC-type sugar transport system ATPase subunit